MISQKKDFFFHINELHRISRVDLKFSKHLASFPSFLKQIQQKVNCGILRLFTVPNTIYPPFVRYNFLRITWYNLAQAFGLKLIGSQWQRVESLKFAEASTVVSTRVHVRLFSECQGQKYVLREAVQVPLCWGPPSTLNYLVVSGDTILTDCLGYH